MDIAFKELQEFSGSQFDPNVVENFIKAMKNEDAKNEETFSLQIIEGNFKKDAA
jgi:response regulator RpfG family c-di-GMP phosphodiesterase